MTRVVKPVLATSDADCSPTIFYRDVPTPLGDMRLVSTAQALCGAWFVDQRMPDSAAWRLDDVHPVLEQARVELNEWFAGERREFDIALAPVGTTFQQQVWRALSALPFGTTVSYGDLAASIGNPKATQAAGGAIGRNPISIFIPCHRVVGRDTSLTGFGGGLARKQALLVHEGHRYVSRSARARLVCDGQTELPW